MTIKTIILDLGNVLVKSNGNKIHEGLSKYSKKDKRYISATFNSNGLESSFELGKIGPQKFFESMKKEYHLNLDRSTFYKIWNSSISPISGSEELLDKLYNEGYKLVLISNTNGEHIRYINRRYNILDYFEHRIYSYQIGFTKPSEKIYREALKLSNSKPEECIFIDDLGANVRSAKRMGMLGILHTSLESTIEKLKSLSVL